MRWYMARHGDGASPVYCSIWANSRLVYTAGNGTARGYGYCKKSASMHDAIESAGFKLSSPIDGVGDSAIRAAGFAIVKTLGFTGKPFVVSHA